MWRVRSVCLVLVLLAIPPGWVSSSGATAAGDCASEAADLTQEQGELPRLEIISPKDRPPYCITLETLIAFAGRIKSHVAHCPASEYASDLASWLKKQTDYSKLFTQYRCKRTL